MENLTQLEFVYLSSNQIDSLKQLKVLVNIKLLDFKSNQILSIKGLENMFKLNDLLYLHKKY